MELGAKALGLLYSAMLDENSEVRQSAAEQWGPIGNPAAKSVLRKALKDSSRYVRIAAGVSLVELGDLSGVAAIESIVKEAPQPPKGDGSALSALDQMRFIAKNKVRAAAIRSLAKLGKKSSEEVIRKALKDPDGAVRDAASVAMAGYGDAREFQRLLIALESGDADIRARGIRGLGEVGTPLAVKAIRPMAEDSDFNVRAAVMEALGAAGSILALPELTAGAGDQNELVRSKAVAGLARLKLPAAIQYLVEARRTASNAYIELLASAGLARLGEPVDTSTARQALYQSDMDIRLLAVEYLEIVESEEALDGLKRALGDSAMEVRVRAAAALVKKLQKPPVKEVTR